MQAAGADHAYVAGPGRIIGAPSMPSGASSPGQQCAQGQQGDGGGFEDSAVAEAGLEQGEVVQVNAAITGQITGGSLPCVLPVAVSLSNGR